MSVFDLAPLADAIDVDGLCAHLTEVMLDEVYSHVIDPKLLQPMLVEATTEKLRCLADLIAGEITLDELEAPSALAFAGEVGRQGIAARMLERSYRVGNEALWDVWMMLVQDHCVRTGDAVGDVVRASIPLLFGFVDRMQLASLGAYHDAVAARQQTRGYRRMRLVEQLLDGTLTSATIDTERFVGYSFGHHHLAAVLDPQDPAADQRFAEELKRAARARNLLMLDRAGSPTQLWLGMDTPLTPSVRAALDSSAAAAGRRLAFGQVRPGLTGFRSSAASAGDAADVQGLLAEASPAVIWAQDVLIEILALGAPQASRALVDSVLGGVLDRGLLTARVRETLDAWFNSGSYVGAAATLRVHEQTVRQRLHQLEHALGHSLHERRTDLHVALRLSRLTFPQTRPPHATR